MKAALRTRRLLSYLEEREPTMQDVATQFPSADGQLVIALYDAIMLNTLGRGSSVEPHR